MFVIIKPQEEDGFDWTLDSDRKRCLVVRDGDNMIVPFQCDLCHFCNLVKRDLLKSDEGCGWLLGIEEQT